MPISLVPPDVSAPDASTPDPTTMTEEQVRARLATVSTEALEAWRAAALKMNTSELIVWLLNPGAIVERVITQADVEAKREDLVMSAAMLAVANEIDRRVPGGR